MQPSSLGVKLLKQSRQIIRFAQCRAINLSWNCRAGEGDFANNLTREAARFYLAATDPARKGAAEAWYSRGRDPGGSKEEETPGTARMEGEEMLGDGAAGGGMGGGGAREQSGVAFM